MGREAGSYRREAAPSQTQLVYGRHPETGQPVEGHLRWGFIPRSSATRPSVQPIHVRAESIAEKPTFAESYRKRRCVVPMNSYYQKDANGRRHTISRHDGALFAAAGIWDNWKNPQTGEWERTFATSRSKRTRLSLRFTIACLPFSIRRALRVGWDPNPTRTICCGPTLPIC